MLPIDKGKPPRELADAKRRIKGTPDAVLNWEGLDGHERKAVLRSLIDEQGGLCAYCTRRISEENAHVEHWIPRSFGTGDDDPDSVDYGNLLAVCDGFERSAAGLTCDRARGDAPLTVNPLKHDTLEGIRYHRDGRIRSSRPDVERDIDRTLNLNQGLLMESRQAVVRELERQLERLGKRRGSQAVRSFCRHYIDRHIADPRERSPYDGTMIYFMRKRLRAAD